MSQYNLGSLSSSGNAIQVVSAGDPPTLVVNHSTKNTVYIGATNMVGSGNLLDATPLDPYASVVMDGASDVWAVAQVATLPATVYTFPNAINWTPQAVQPNIEDPNTGWTPGTGPHSITLTIEPRAEGLAVSFLPSTNVTSLIIIGVQSGIQYVNVNPTAEQEYLYWVPILSDNDTQVMLNMTIGVSTPIGLTWIMSSFIGGLVSTGQIGDVNIRNVSDSASISVGESNIQTYANQTAVAINANLGIGATQVILPAVALRNYFIHSIRIEGVAASAFFAMLQDTTGTTFSNLFQEIAGAPTNTFRPPMGDNQFHGMPLGIGLGLQILNSAGVAQQYIGHVVFSHT